MLGPDYIPLLLLTGADRLSPQQDRLPAGQTPRENTMGASDSVVPSGLAPGHRPNRARPRARPATIRLAGTVALVRQPRLRFQRQKLVAIGGFLAPPRARRRGGKRPRARVRRRLQRRCRLMLSDKARPLRRLLLRLQPKLFLPSR